MKHLTFVLAVLSLTLSAPAIAETEAAALNPLLKLVGNWHLTATITSSGQPPIRVSGPVRCTKTSGDSGVVCTKTLRGMPGLATYLETDLFGINAADGVAHLGTVSNAGEAATFTGTVKEQGCFFQRTANVPGGVLTERFTVTFASPSTARLYGQTYLDGELVSTVSSVMTRVPASNAQ